MVAIERTPGLTKGLEVVWGQFACLCQQDRREWVYG
jgi:hypothetical protein